jgi:polysaccharide biosynthesis protein PslH
VRHQVRCVALPVEDFRSLDGGSRIRNFHLISAIASIAATEVFTFTPRRQIDRSVQVDFPVHARPPERSLTALAKSVLGRRSYHAQLFDLRLHGDRLLTALDGADLVFVSTLSAAPYLSAWAAARRTRPPIVWDAMDYYPDWWLQRRDAWRHPRRAMAQLQVVAVRRQMESLARLADVLVVCSDSDADKFRRDFPLKPAITVVPNGADVERWQSVRAIAPDGADFVIFGNLGQDSTAAGAEWFLERVWPGVVATVPAATLVVTGRTPSRRLRSKVTSSPGATIVADPIDMVSEVGRCRTILVPQAFGTGSKIKVYEALSTGRPIIANSPACVGIPQTLCGYITQADSPEQWRRLCVSAATSGLPSSNRPRSEDLRSVAWTQSSRMLIETISSFAL